MVDSLKNEGLQAAHGLVSYACFLFKISDDFKGFARINYKNGILTLHENETERALTMQVGELFPH